MMRSLLVLCCIMGCFTGHAYCAEVEGEKLRLTIPIQRYRLYPKSGKVADFSTRNFGPEERPFEFSPDDTAIISIDTWYVGHDGPLSFAEHTYMGNGSEVVARIKDICDNRIAPLLAAARQVGIQVIHSEPSFIANRPEYRRFHIYPRMEVSKPEDDDWPPATFRKQLQDEISRWSWGKGVNQWPAVTRRMDFPPSLKPVQGDIVITQDHATVAKLQRLFKERKITNLLYVGFLTNCCIMLKPGGTIDMAERKGYRVIVFRDCCQSSETEDTVSDFSFQRTFIKNFEICNSFTANSRDFIRAARRTDVSESSEKGKR